MLSTSQGLIRPSTHRTGAPVSSHRNRTEACACASTTELLTSRPSRTNIDTESMTCLTSSGARIFPTGSAVRIWQIRMADNSIHKTAFPNSVRMYEYLVMPFDHQRAGNVPSRNEPHSTITLDECVVVYLDDILIYSRDMKQHVDHLRRVFEILRRERFYVKLSKSEFALEKVQFLGHLVSAQGVHLLPNHQEKYPIPRIDDLLDQLRGANGIFQTGSAVRILADTDGGQLYPQNCFPNSVRIVRVFGHAVRTHQRAGNVPSRNEPHSTTTLDECVVVYLDDILIYSRDMKQHVEHLRRVFEILRRERFYVKLSKSEFALERSKKRHLLQWDSDIAYRKGSTKIWVPNYPPLRQLLLEEYHDVPYAGHFGSNKTLTGIAKHYYWPHMADDVQKFVTSCDTCQRMKSSKQKKAGLLQPLPVPEQPWQVVSLDFITELPPTSSGHDAILVVIDKFSKMGHFIPTHTTARTEETAQLFVRHIISQHGIPTTLISDRDPSSLASSGRNLCLCSAPNSPCPPHTIRRQTDRPSASTKLLSNSSEQPARTTFPNGTCTCPYSSLLTTMPHMPLLDRRRSSSATDATHSHHKNRQHQQQYNLHTTSSQPCISFGIGPTSASSIFNSNRSAKPIAIATITPSRWETRCFLTPATWTSATSHLNFDLASAGLFSLKHRTNPIHVDPKKIEAVRTWKTPENVKELQQFLGFANYYNRFVPQYAKIAAPLTNLLKKNTPYKWEPKHQEAVEQLKQALTSAPVLILPDPERDYVIEADASDQAVGAVLMQDQGNGLQPIAYLSKKLHGAELNYPIHDKEALAIVIAFKAWRCYLEGRRTTVYTDHCSLKYLKTQPNLSRRQVRWIDFLETHFHYDIVYKPGHKNKADALRPACTRCRDSGRRDESTTQGTLHPRPRLHHRVTTTSSGHDAILVVIDKFSKMGHFIPTHTTARTEETAQLFVRHIISQHGIPTTLISDRDPKFTSKFWKELMSLLGTKLAMSSAYHPQTDGQTERLNQIVEQLLREPARTTFPNGTCTCPYSSLLTKCHTCRYWTDAVLPLLRTPPTHTTETDNTSNSSTCT
ncbi:hypothetical protein CLOM_g9349 [Closterium sp. NIES-68]|nr:hypothetical protein CLOM_g9349 [Closterium sp. NIES-68]